VEGEIDDLAIAVSSPSVRENGVVDVFGPDVVVSDVTVLEG
jgi:hypothetical protein